jgi:hypothetical protein
MAKHIIVLKYDTTNGFTPEEDLRVHKGDTISFELVTTPPNLNAKFEITMDSKFFKPKTVTDNTPIEVIEALQKRTTYQCNFSGADGEPLRIGKEKQPGGGVRP